MKRALIAIGASAGGPAALATLLAGLPRGFPAAVVIVQHIDEHMALSMTEWLSQRCPLPIRPAVEGDRIEEGRVLLAATSDHLVLKSAERLGYIPEPQELAYRPSVDVFLHSVATRWRGDVVGVLLTGMGRDGAHGLKALRDKGYHTIAQDKESSAVYGMPKAAAALNAATDVLPLTQIAPKLVALFGNPDRRGEISRRDTSS